MRAQRKTCIENVLSVFLILCAFKHINFLSLQKEISKIIINSTRWNGIRPPQEKITYFDCELHDGKQVSNTNRCSEQRSLGSDLVALGVIDSLCGCSVCFDCAG
jgi:hypothetical protein